MDRKELIEFLKNNLKLEQKDIKKWGCSGPYYATRIELVLYNKCPQEKTDLRYVLAEVTV